MKATHLVSKVDPEWSVCSYPNGYFYYRTEDETRGAVEPMYVPEDVKTEIGKLACSLIVPTKADMLAAKFRAAHERVVGKYTNHSIGCE